MRWEDVACSQGGAIARRQLVEFIGSDTVDGMVRRHDVLPVYPGVYRDRATPLTQLGRYWSAVLWSGGSLAYGSAAQLWGMPVVDPTRVQVLAADLLDRKAGLRSIKLWRVACPAYDRTTLRGLPITTRDRTLIDLLGVMELPRGRELLGWALRRGWVEPWQLDRRLIDGRGRAGNVRIRKLACEADPRSHAEFERRVSALLRLHKITGWTQQYPVPLPSGAVMHADFAFPARKLIVELDGWAYHNSGERFRKDRRRWRAAVAAGWRVVQFTFDDLDRPDRLIREICGLLVA